MTGRRRAGRPDKSSTPPSGSPTPSSPKRAAPKPKGMGAANVTPGATGSKEKAPPAPPPPKPTPTPKPAPPKQPARQVSGSRTTRRAVREQQQKDRRKRSILIISVVVLVALVGGLVVWLQSRGGDAAPPPASTGRTTHSLTLTLAEPGQEASSGALLVADPTDATASGVLIPSHVYVTGPTPDGVPFGETVQLGSAGAPGEALASTLDVIVDNTWQLSSDELAALVDAVDGVVVDVDSDVVVNENGQKKIVIASGDAQLLNGQQAAQFAQYRAPGEPEEVRLARFRQVVEQLIRRMPTSSEDVTKLLHENKADRVITSPTTELANFLVAFGNVARSGDAEFQSLPTRPLPSVGHGIEASTPDDEGVAQLRESELAGIVPPGVGGQQIDVMVQNGVGTPGIEQDASKQLTDAGFKFVNGGNANSFNYDKSVVVIPDATEASVAVGQKVANALGLPDSAVKVGNQGSNVADVIVILGADYKP